MDTPPDNIANALKAAELGYTPVPVLPGTKIPAVKWKPWQTEIPPAELIRVWFAQRRNLAIVMHGLVVFDCDDPTQAELVIAECGDTPHKRSRRRAGCTWVTAGARAPCSPTR